MKQEVKRWITVNGNHVPIYEDGYEDSSESNVYIPKGTCIEERLWNMQTIDEDNLKNCLPVISNEEIDEIEAKFKKEREAGNISYKKTEVDIKDLYTAQEWIDEEMLLEKTKIKGIIDGTAGTDDETYRNGIIATKYKGKIIIGNGNHRVNAAILKRQKRIKLWLCTI